MALNPSDNQKPFESFIDILDQICGTVHSISQIERRKAQAASQGEHEAMDGILKEEQALLLKLRGLEQHRMKLQEGLGWKDLKFRQILEKVPDGQQKALDPLFQRLDRELTDFLSVRESSERIVKVKLREIDILLARRGIQGYGGDGSITAPPPLHTHDTYV